MASIQQKSLFVWGDIDELGDLERLRLVLEQLPDEALMRKLEQKRYRGRDDYPARAMQQDDTKLWQAGSNKKKAQCPDGRRDTDAVWGVKRYCGVGKDGKPANTTKRYQEQTILCNTWKRLNAMRIAVERVNARIDGAFLLSSKHSNFRRQLVHPTIARDSRFLPRVSL